jgi:hypothetical protein
MGPKGVPDTKTDRSTDRRSEHQLNLAHEQGREREKKKVGGSERHYRFGGGCKLNIIWQFGRFPGSAR